MKTTTQRVPNRVPNGCNVITLLHRFFFGHDLPFRWPCCDEHDLACEQGGDRTTRKWADDMFRDFSAPPGSVMIRRTSAPRRVSE